MRRTSTAKRNPDKPAPGEEANRHVGKLLEAARKEAIRNRELLTPKQVIEEVRRRRGGLPR